MSRIGKLPIAVPSGVTVTIQNGVAVVKGPKGELSTKIPSQIKVTVDGTVMTVERPTANPADRALHGLTRALLNNMVDGVSKGFDRKLELNGVGFRAQAQGKKLTLQLGFSHPVVVEAPEGIAFKVEENIVTVSGIDRQVVGETAARIRAFYVPEPYKGKGIRYTDEHVVRKEGKRVAAAGGA